MLDTSDIFKKLRVGTCFTAKSSSNSRNSALNGNASRHQSFASNPIRKRNINMNDDTEIKHKKLKISTDTGNNIITVKQLRKQNRIFVKGSDIPDPVDSFHILNGNYTSPNLSQLIENLILSGFLTPTPVQMQAIPIYLRKRDLLCSAPTGSGKTVAFVLPILSHLSSPSSKAPRALVLTPTLELAAQILRDFQQLNRGINLKIHQLTKSFAVGQILSSQHRPDVLIATPKRLVHILTQNPSSLDLSSVEWLVLDEADKLFECESKDCFIDQIRVVISACSNPDLHYGMFSATLSEQIEQWCQHNIPTHVRLTVGVRNTANSMVKQELKFVGSEEGKLIAIRQMVSAGELQPPVLIFVQSVDRAHQLFRALVYEKIKVDIIHSQRSQAQRDNVVKAFRSGKLWVLICTELISRGMDFKGVNMVINFDLPNSLISYIHRVGRTGRAGYTGMAVTFFTEDDLSNIRKIASVIHKSGQSVPGWMLKLQKPGHRERKKREKLFVKRKPILSKNKLRQKKIKRTQNMAEPFCFECKFKFQVGDSANVISVFWYYKYELYSGYEDHLIPRIDNSLLFNYNGKLLRSLANNLNYYILCNMCLDIFVSKYQIDPKHPIIPKGIICYDNSLRRACLELYPIELIVKLHINDKFDKQRTLKISKNDSIAKLLSLAKQELNFTSEKVLVSIQSSSHIICSSSKINNKSLSELNVVNGSTIHINCDIEDFKYDNTTAQDSASSTSFLLSSANYDLNVNEYDELNNNTLIRNGCEQIESLVHRNSINSEEFTPKSPKIVKQENASGPTLNINTATSSISKIGSIDIPTLQRGSTDVAKYQKCPHHQTFPCQICYSISSSVKSSEQLTNALAMDKTSTNNNDTSKRIGSNATSAPFQVSDTDNDSNRIERNMNSNNMHLCKCNKPQFNTSNQHQLCCDRHCSYNCDCFLEYSENTYNGVNDINDLFSYKLVPNPNITKLEHLGVNKTPLTNVDKMNYTEENADSSNERKPELQATTRVTNVAPLAITSGNSNKDKIKYKTRIAIETSQTTNNEHKSEMLQPVSLSHIQDQGLPCSLIRTTGSLNDGNKDIARIVTADKEMIQDSESQESTDYSCNTTSTSNFDINNPLNNDIIAKKAQHDLQEIPENTLSNNIYKWSSVRTASSTEATPTTAKIYQTKPILAFINFFFNLVKTDKIKSNPSVLHNIGNSCYMNCGLQCVAQIPEIIRYFIEGEYSASINYDNPLGMKGRLVKSFAELIIFMWDSNNTSRIFKPRAYKQLIGEYNNTFADYSQQDAVEHLVCMLDALHEETKQKAEDTRCADVNGNSSIISRTFYGKLESSITYDTCQHTSSQVEDFAILSLSIVKPKLLKQSTSNTNIASNNACDTSRWFTIKYIDAVSNSYKELSHIISPKSLVKSHLLLDWRTELVYLVYKNKRILKVWRKPGNTEHVINVIRPDGLHYYKFEIEGPSKMNKQFLEMRSYFKDLERANLIICLVTEGKFVRKLNENFNSNDIPFDHNIVVYDMGTTSADKCVLIENVVINYETNSSTAKNFGIPFVLELQLVNNSTNNIFQSINDRMKSLINNEFILKIPERKSNVNISVQGSAATPSLDRTNITLNDCIADYVCERIIEDKSSITCQECNAPSTKFRKKITLYSLPRVLIIQLKRFQRSSHSRSNYSSFEKSRELVEYPNRLLLEESGNDNIINKVEYELRAVINHYGTMRGGDYDAIVKQFTDDNWCEYNFITNTATQISSNKVSDCAYVLLYYKCD